MGRKFANSSKRLRSSTLMLEKPPPMGVLHRALQSDSRALDRLGEFFRDVFLVFFEGLGTGGKSLPFELHAGRFQDANGGVRNFRTNAVARDESNFMRHKS
jgi:hypothetical protein